MLVVLFHMGYRVPGPMGVVIFFVISGFLITTLLLRESSATGRISIRRFYRNRTYRIFPAFYAAWFGTMLVLKATHQPIPKVHALLSVLYLADYGRAFTPDSQQATFPLTQSWSLAIEEQFYLLWPLVLIWPLRRKQPLAGLSTGIVVLWTWRVLFLTALHGRVGYAYNAFETRADAIFVGCWLAMALTNDRLTEMLKDLIRARFLTMLTLVGFVAVGSVEVIGPITPIVFAGLLTIEPVLAAALILQLAYWIPKGWGPLDSRPIRWLAGLAYSTYLTHIIAVDLVGRQHHFREIIAMLVLACSSYFLVERPFLRLRDRPVHHAAR